MNQGRILPQPATNPDKERRESWWFKNLPAEILLLEPLCKWYHVLTGRSIVLSIIINHEWSFSTIDTYFESSVRARVVFQLSAVQD